MKTNLFVSLGILFGTLALAPAAGICDETHTSDDGATVGYIYHDGQFGVNADLSNKYSSLNLGENMGGAVAAHHVAFDVDANFGLEFGFPPSGNVNANIGVGYAPINKDNQALSILAVGGFGVAGDPDPNSEYKAGLRAEYLSEKTKARLSAYVGNRGDQDTVGLAESVDAELKQRLGQNLDLLAGLNALYRNNDGSWIVGGNLGLKYKLSDMILGETQVKARYDSSDNSFRPVVYTGIDIPIDNNYRATGKDDLLAADGK